ncbi:hypothetical protein BGX38DRAFT_1269488 [Terfezia claveryi]|nr:hypothetical protein BGX38DRAFT_1269488 [Terfezia claveryi]
MVTLLLDQGADINLTTSGKFGPALCAAAATGQLEMAKLLLNRGANPDLTNNLGQKPRDIAQLEKHPLMLILFDSYARKTENQPVASKPPPMDQLTSEPSSYR